MSNETEYTTITANPELVRYIMSEIGGLLDRLCTDSQENRISMHVAILAALQNHFCHAHVMMIKFTEFPLDKAMLNFDAMQAASRDRIVKELGLENTNETDPHKH